MELQFVMTSVDEMTSRQMCLSGYIGNYFFNNNAPSWTKISTALRKYEVKKLFGFEVLPEEFLQVLFASDSTLVKAIPEFTYRNHQVIMMFLKEEYSLVNCAECGYYTRTTGFNWRRRFESITDGLNHCPPSSPVQESEEKLTDEEENVKTPDTTLICNSDTSTSSCDVNVNTK